MERQKYWTEAIAVGSQEWIEGMKGKIGTTRLRIVNEAVVKQSKKQIKVYTRRKKRANTMSSMRTKRHMRFIEKPIWCGTSGAVCLRVKNILIDTYAFLLAWKENLNGLTGSISFMS